jgi:hypothetical protein
MKGGKNHRKRRHHKRADVSSTTRSIALEVGFDLVDERRTLVEAVTAKPVIPTMRGRR